VKCETCHGSGAKAGTKPDACSYCRGHGQVQVTQGFFTISTTCPQCRGEGAMIKEKCGECSGRGVVKQTRNLSVKVPPGVSDGMRLLMRGEGEVGENGGPQGDLYVYIHVKDHAEFYREEDDVISEIKINFADLALGSELSVNTIEGATKIKIKAGTDSGEIIKLKGKGIANIRTGKRGDHIFKIQAVTPKELSLKQKQLLEELSQELRGPGAPVKSKKKKKGFF
jgi:molecular chaperone DnaJ